MKFLHLADLHLGKRLNDFSFLEDQVRLLCQVEEIARSERADAVLIAGDVYQKASPQSEAMAAFDQFITRLKEMGLAVFVISGNHDSAQRISYFSSLLKNSGVYVSEAFDGHLQQVTLQDEHGELVVSLLPFLKPIQLRRFYPDEKIETYQDAVQAVLRHSPVDTSKRNVLVCHQFITGAETSDSEEKTVGGLDNIDAAVFADFDYVALGHIHKPQQVSPHVRYSGSPMAYSFGKEERQEKSVTLIDTAAMTREVVPLPLLHRWTTLTDCYEALLAGEYPEEIREGYVRLNVTDTAVGLDMLSRLRQVYPNALVVAGKTYDGEDTTITLTMEQLEQMESDPAEVFKSFCREEMGQEATDHFLQLFAQAVEEADAE